MLGIQAHYTSQYTDGKPLQVSYSTRVSVIKEVAFPFSTWGDPQEYKVQERSVARMSKRRGSVTGTFIVECTE